MIVKLNYLKFLADVVNIKVLDIKVASFSLKFVIPFTAMPLNGRYFDLDQTYCTKSFTAARKSYLKSLKVAKFGGEKL